MISLSSHVLDTSIGKPAQGLSVTLEREESAGNFSELAKAKTDSDGRVKVWGAQTEFKPGTYRFTFETGSYFSGQGKPVFYPIVSIVVALGETTGHYHIPLLLSGYGYSTYRGS